MSDRDAWIHFYCVLLNKQSICSETALRAADNALVALRECDKIKMFDRPDTNYRDQSDCPEYK